MLVDVEELRAGELVVHENVEEIVSYVDVDYLAGLKGRMVSWAMGCAMKTTRKKIDRWRHYTKSSGRITVHRSMVA